MVAGMHDGDVDERPRAAWLLDDVRVLGSIELATTARSRTKGLLGRDGIDGAMLIEPAKQVHTFGMRFPIDVAFARDVPDRTPAEQAGETDRQLEILDVVTMLPGRLGKPRVRARLVIEAQAGSFARWGIGAGHTVQVRGMQ